MLQLILAMPSVTKKQKFWEIDTCGQCYKTFFRRNYATIGVILVQTIIIIITHAEKTDWLNEEHIECKSALCLQGCKHPLHWSEREREEDREGEGERERESVYF